MGRHYVYILASRRNGTLYIGFTNNLMRRTREHRLEVNKGFTSRYGIKKLVWFEIHPNREAAFLRERQLKKWKRAWKLDLIEQKNPKWKDFSSTWY